MRVEVVQSPTYVIIEDATYIVAPEISEVRVISAAEQGPAGAMTFRVFDAVWQSELLISWSDYDLFRIVLGGNTSFDFEGAVDGQRVILELQQDGTGNRTVQLPANVRYSSGMGSVTLSTAPGATDRIGFMYNEATDTYDLMAFMPGF